MDHSLKTIEEPWLHHNNRTSKIESENVYVNDLDQAQEAKRTGSALSDLKKSSFCRAAAVSLGLLCLLLLIGLSLILILLYAKGNSKQDQLQSSYDNVTKERDQLQKKFDDMAKEKNDLEKKLKDFGWVYFNGSSYYISPQTKSWQQSRDDCWQRGADLVIINSKEEQEFLRSFQRRMWIGLTDSGAEGTWIWVDGTPLSTSYWAPTEPNDWWKGGEDCAEIKEYTLENSWND